MYTLRNDKILFELNENNGLAQITNLENGTCWKQFYPVAPANQCILSSDFTDTSLWDYDLELNGTLLKGSGKVALRKNFPIPGLGIAAGNYEARLIADGDLEGVEITAEYYTTVQNQSDVFLLASVPLETEICGNRINAKLNEKDMPFGTDQYILTAVFKGDVTVKEFKVYHLNTETLPIKVVSAENIGDKIVLKLIPQTAKHEAYVTCKITLSDDEIIYDIIGDVSDRFEARLHYPPMFHTGEDDLFWLLPKDSGIMLKSTDLEHEAHIKIPMGEFYVVPGLNMAFIGALNGKKDGCMMLVDTPLCTKVGYTIADVGGKAAYCPDLQHFGDKGLWAENRRARIKPVSCGGYVAMAKVYREIAKQKGYLKTFAEKAAENPTFGLSVGTHRIDSGLDYRDLPRLCEALYAADTKNVMLKFTASRDNGAYLKGHEILESGILDEYKEKYSDILLYDYENTRDLYITQGEFDVIEDYVEIAYPNRSVAENGEYYKGWIDNTGNIAYILCPHFARKYIDYRINKYPIDKHPYMARLFDIFATTNLSEGECYDKTHPSSRLETAELRKDVLKYTREKYGLDVHTEGTAEYYVPLCNTMEGSLEIMNYPGVGLRQERYDVDPKIRVPLWQLVFHDCASTYLHWEHGDLQNTTKDYDDALVMLYGERGMFLPGFWATPFDNGLIEDMTSRIKKLNIVTEKVKNSEMISHSFLSEDGFLQKTAFKGGVEVIANLNRDNSYTVDGVELAPWKVLVYHNGIKIYG